MHKPIVFVRIQVIAMDVNSTVIKYIRRGGVPHCLTSRTKTMKTSTMNLVLLVVLAALGNNVSMTKRHLCIGSGGMLFCCMLLPYNHLSTPNILI